MFDWVVYVHVLSAMLFFLMHGASAAASFMLRKERKLERIQALLDVSQSTNGMGQGALLVLLATGVAEGFIDSQWSTGWLWTSVALFFVIVFAMFGVGTLYYGKVRKAAGLQYMEGSKVLPAEKPASADEIARLLDSPRAMILGGIGLLGMAAILWLMMFKPF
jgi:hypothetical protein